MPGMAADCGYPRPLDLAFLGWTAADDYSGISRLGFIAPAEAVIVPLKI